MRKVVLLFIVAALLTAAVGATVAQADSPGGSNANDAACWGQASAVFAQMGSMGEHASQLPTPRAGLRNLARQLYADGVIPDDTLQALGAYVADVLGLSITACGI